jgi:Domain of unknown function (DUF1918)
MHAHVGDQMTIRSRHQGDEDRHGTIIRLDGSNEAPSPMRWLTGTRACSSLRPAPRWSITPPGGRRAAARCRVRDFRRLEWAFCLVLSGRRRGKADSCRTSSSSARMRSR